MQTLFIIAAGLAMGVFVFAFRFALQEARAYQHAPDEPDIPRAELHVGRTFSRNPWHRGALRQRLIQVIYYLQATLVAMAITSVFIMFLCMAGVITSILVSSL